MRWRAVVVAAVAALVVAALGASVTDLGPWYQGLAKPSWQPPDPVFGIAWTTIYALTAMSAVIVWRRTSRAAERQMLLAMFGLNAVLNLSWSVLFFHLQRPDWALLGVAALWLSIIALIIYGARHARVAGLLLAPYLAWVTVAAALNFEVVRLNGPFD
jgi:tryptophan-rich sensory protein